MKGCQPLFSIYTRLAFRAILVLMHHCESRSDARMGSKGGHTEYDGWYVEVAKNRVNETYLLRFRPYDV